MMLAPVEVAGQTKAEAEETARALLARVGLADKADVKPNTLSVDKSNVLRLLCWR